MSENGRQGYQDPLAIERRSFEIIESELGTHHFDEPTLAVVRRVIHATADFDYATNLHLTPGAIEAGIEAFKAGATVVCDTTMVAAGINKRVLEGFGGSALSFIADEAVATEARERHVTRSTVSMEHAARLQGPLVFALGNAPTAVIRLAELILEGYVRDCDLVVACPVGFVNVIESKELIERTPVASIVARGRKGGSTVAAAIINALLYLASDDRRS